MNPSLEFSMDLPEKAVTTLIEGMLTIKEKPGTGGTKLLATSGLRGCQYKLSWVLEGKGCLPPTSAAPDQYHVSKREDIKKWQTVMSYLRGSKFSRGGRRSRTLAQRHSGLPFFTGVVLTQGLSLPNIKGVEGNFYPLAPFQVSVNGVSRGDFGCHNDPLHSTPGSSGCIVTRLTEHWEILQGAFLKFRTAGFQQVPLIVSYY